jgi:hypothetical protein
MRKTGEFLIVLLFATLAFVAKSIADETSVSHVAHLSGAHGPQITCGTSCHVDPYTGLFLDGKDLANTNVCDTCHSPGGIYNGVDFTVNSGGAKDNSVGAKDNWVDGVYDGGALKHGLERWCVGCHDDNPSVVNGVSAPNVAGNFSGSAGFYNTGHGRELGGLQEISCLVCHDAALVHVDGEARTYTAAADNYQAGYRLKSVDGQEPMDIPRSWAGWGAWQFRLCFSCHDSAPFVTRENTDTNFRSDVNNSCEPLDPATDWVNKHYYHLQTGNPFKKWDSDVNGWQDSVMSCPACHNVHGAELKDKVNYPNISNAPAMIRTGELIGRTNSLNLDYMTDPCPGRTHSATNELAGSTGGEMKFYWSGRGTIEKGPGTERLRDLS